MTAWLTQLLRLTIFPYGEQANFSPNEWWQKIVGEEPDIVNAQPKLMHYSLQSDYELGTLILESQPGRIDWLYTIPESDNLDSLLGGVEHALKTFTTMADRWFGLDACPPASRIAFGTILLIPAESRQKAYKMLSKFLPAVQLDENSSDFLYQINRPRQIDMDNLDIKVNRLSKWSARAAHQQNITLSGGGLSQLSSILLHIASAVELDINTSQEYSGALAPEIQGRIFGQLVEFGKEIASKGDIP